MGRRTPPPDDGLAFDYSKFRTVRRMLDQTQRGTAAAIGVHANAILNMEKGRGRGLYLEDFVRAARFFGTPLNDLFEVFDRDGRNAKPHRVRR